MSDSGFRLQPKWKQRSEYRAKMFGKQRAFMNRLAVFLLGVIVIVAAINSIANRKDDWTESCSDYEVNQGTAGERFDPFHVALTENRYSRTALNRLRQAVWQDLPLCRELVELASLSLQLYNDLLFADAAPGQGLGIFDFKQHDRWHELFLRLHEK